MSVQSYRFHVAFEGPVSGGEIGLARRSGFTCPITRMRDQHRLDDDKDACEDDYVNETS